MTRRAHPLLTRGAEPPDATVIMRRIPADAGGSPVVGDLDALPVHNPSGAWTSATQPLGRRLAG